MRRGGDPSAQPPSKRSKREEGSAAAAQEATEEAAEEGRSREPNPGEGRDRCTPPFGHCSAVATVAPQCLLQHSKAAARLTIPLLLLSVVAEATGRSWMLCLTPTPMAKHTTSKRMIYEPLTYHLLTFTTANTISPPPCDRNCAHSSWCRLVSTHRLAQRPYRHWPHIVPSRIVLAHPPAIEMQCDGDKPRLLHPTD